MTHIPATVAAMVDDIFVKESKKYTNRPTDRGGPTKFGITLAKLSEWRGRPVTAAEVAALEEPEARSIYEHDFITGPRFIEITDPALRWLVIDCGVNHGVNRAGKWLQEAAGVTVDGKIGPKTLAAVNAADPRILFKRLLARRYSFYAAIVDNDRAQADNIEGWINRANSFLLLT